MRFVMLLLGLGLIALAGLWFFTPVLDSTYARHLPGISQSHSRSGAPAGAPGGQARGASPGAGAPAASSSGTVQIGSKALADNLMSIVNVATGLLGAIFTFMSYRAQVSQRRGRD